MVFNATFNNISVISWQSVLLVEETRVPRENHWPVASHGQIWSHNVVSSTSHLSGIQTHNLVVIGTDCIGSCRSRPRRQRSFINRWNYYTFDNFDYHIFITEIPLWRPITNIVLTQLARCIIILTTLTTY